MIATQLADLARPLYQPIEHEEFALWEVKQKCEERLGTMLRALGSQTGTMVDLGCHTGWFCRAFARLGWDVIGIDRSEAWIYAARVCNALLDEAAPVRPPFYTHSDLETAHIPKSDVALCLSVAMYLFEGSREDGWHFLQKVSRQCKAMFLDFGGMYAHHLPFTEADAIEQIVKVTYYTDGKLIGHSHFENRPMFMFTR